MIFQCIQRKQSILSDLSNKLSIDFFLPFCSSSFQILSSPARFRFLPLSVIAQSIDLFIFIVHYATRRQALITFDSKRSLKAIRWFVFENRSSKLICFIDRQESCSTQFDSIEIIHLVELDQVEMSWSS